MCGYNELLTPCCHEKTGFSPTIKCTLYFQNNRYCRTGSIHSWILSSPPLTSRILCDNCKKIDDHEIKEIEREIEERKKAEEEQNQKEARWIKDIGDANSQTNAEDQRRRLYASSFLQADLTYQAHRSQLLLASRPTTTPPHTSPLITMCSKRVSPYHECPYSHKEVTDEKFCFRDGVIVPCVNWEWLIIKEHPTPGPCPCADCQAWKRRQNMQNGTAGSRSNDISQ
ncbi:hypothetical protein D6D20_07461 [Aureobasidium pullulans]|uniref:Uncharacterized protein n=1 Tax=Aureobasidium pullulans TaxID=5580 RepID=A0A4V4IMG4_AURPU|nr:hypothetical protein D6D20_07461 [Aureobasidium pullulans]